MVQEPARLRSAETDPRGHRAAEPPSRTAFFLDAAAIGVLAIGAAHRLWSFSFGYDITDEGQALVAAANPAELRIWPSAFAWYTALLLGLVRGDIAGFRRAGFALLLLSALALATGLRRFLGREAPSLTVLVAALGCGALLFYSPGLPTPSYNLLTAAALYVSTALALAASAGGARRGATVVAASGAGVATAVLFLVKAPAGLLAAGAHGFLLLRGRRAGTLAAYAFGVAAGLAQHWARQGLDAWAQMMADGLLFLELMESGHTFGALSRYASDLGKLGGDALIVVAGGLLGAFALGSLSVSHRAALRLVGLGLGLVAGLLPMASGLLGGHRASVAGSTLSAVLGIVLACGLFLLFERRRFGGHPTGPETRLAITLLLALPLIGALGTNTPLGFSLQFFAAPWLALVAVVAGKALGRLGPSLSLLAALVPTVASTAAPYRSPYRWAEPLQGQRAEVKLGEAGSSLVVDKRTARFLRGLRGAAKDCGLSPGGDVLGFVWVPGLVYAVGGHTVAITHFAPGWVPGAASANRFALSRIPGERLRAARVIHAERATGRVFPALNIAGQRVPEDYDVCFSGQWPLSGDTIRLLRPRPSPTGSTW